MENTKVVPIKVRTITSNLIIHNDLAIGPGKVSQQRGKTVTKEQSIELDWIFRSVDEIQQLDVKKYTRVSLHREGQCSQYWYSATADAEQDLQTVLQPYVGTGRWLLVEFVDIEARKMIAELQEQLNARNT